MSQAQKFIERAYLLLLHPNTPMVQDQGAIHTPTVGVMQLLLLGAAFSQEISTYSPQEAPCVCVECSI